MSELLNDKSVLLLVKRGDNTIFLALKPKG